MTQQLQNSARKLAGWMSFDQALEILTNIIKIYSGAELIFIEEDIFITIIPLTSYDGEHVSCQAGRTKEILEFCKIPKTRSEIQEFLGITSKVYVRVKILNPLIKSGLLKLTKPDKPTIPNQKYYNDKK